MKKISLIAVALCAILLMCSARQGERQLTPDQKLRLAAALIDNYYVEEVDNDTLVSEAIIAMLKTLDPHSAYSTPDETKELNQPLEGKFSGIGIQFNMVEDTLYVIQTTQGGPSEKVGIRPGDRILSLDGHPWDGDVCRFLLDPDPLDGTVCGIGTASGQHVVLTIETMK